MNKMSQQNQNDDVLNVIVLTLKAPTFLGNSNRLKIDSHSANPDIGSIFDFT